MEGTTIGAVMIVRNEETTLGGILSDIKGVVDEICVVDTGSTDSTVALAESFGARVHHFPWIDDFSAARNHSIACARSDYLIWLDADDRIDEASRQALLELKQRLKPQKNKAYMLKIIGCSEDMPETVSFQTRIVPNVRDVCFEGRVHEQILPSLRRLGIDIQQTGITIRHTGYHSPEQRRAKAARNLAILERELADGKDTATQYFFMAMAAIGLGEHERCLEYIENARKRRTNEDWLHYSHVISCECLFRLGRFQDAMAELERGTGL
ncbi:MAG TPA: glycosyltransferase family 2 protein, partial [Deltaproteobacteria bacterium]|nr:glycosyltransferase family 2 protein [Deltaproteobacteria bacterium]